MFRNLQIEWMKIRHYRVFQVFSALYMIGIIIIIYIVHNLYTKLTGRLTGRDNSDILNLFSETTIWKTTCFSTSFLLYLPGMILINLFVNEVNFKTHRQNIIDGWKRETFIYSKIMLNICFAVVITLMNVIAAAVMCGVTGVHFSLAAGIETLGLSFIQSFVYLMFALLLATLFRRSGVALIIFFVYGLLIEFLLMLLFWKIAPGLQHFLPLQVSDSLISYPDMGGIFADRPELWIMVVASFAFAGIYTYFTTRKYKYDDL